MNPDIANASTDGLEDVSVPIATKNIANEIPNTHALIKIDTRILTVSFCFIKYTIENILIIDNNTVITITNFLPILNCSSCFLSYIYLKK